MKEVYAEFFVPMLKDLPGVHALNLTAGIRYSDYSRETIGNSTNSEFKVEYRPISDILVRALVRGSVPRADDRGPVAGADAGRADVHGSLRRPDPGAASRRIRTWRRRAKACRSMATSRSRMARSRACSWATRISKPETGDVLTYGVVYDSSQIRGLSLTVDFWKYKIDDLITQLDPNFAVEPVRGHRPADSSAT